MVELFSMESLFTLFMLIMLQAVLGFDNLLYIAIESNKVDPKDSAKVRRWGIILRYGVPDRLTGPDCPVICLDAGLIVQTPV